MPAIFSPENFLLGRIFLIVWNLQLAFHFALCEFSLTVSILATSDFFSALGQHVASSSVGDTFTCRSAI